MLKKTIVKNSVSTLQTKYPLLINSLYEIMTTSHTLTDITKRSQLHLCTVYKLIIHYQQNPKAIKNFKQTQLHIHCLASAVITSTYIQHLKTAPMTTYRTSKDNTK